MHKFVYLTSFMPNGLEINIRSLYNHLADIKENDPNTIIYFFDIFENRKVDKAMSLVIESYRTLLEYIGLEYYFVIDGSYDDHELFNDTRVISLNWGLFYVYYMLVYKHHPKIETYNPLSSKGLYLVGKANSEHRILPLKRLYETKNLDKAIWTFKNSPGKINQIKNDFFKEYTPQQFSQFLSVCAKTIDYKPCYIQDTNAYFAHLGMPCDIELYKNTGFSFINETTVSEPVHRLTEKTWRAIAFKHPFIMMGDVNNFAYLNKCGFKTFEEYMCIPDYYKINDIKKKTEAIIKNWTHLFNLLSNKNSVAYKQICSDVEHNYHMFLDMGKSNIEVFLSSCGLSESDLESIIRFHSEYSYI